MTLKNYIEQTILPQYDAFDGGHRRDHAETVIRESLKLARENQVDEQMAYVIAAYHDLGLRVDREKHHIHSGEILMADKTLRQWFTEEQLLTMRDAIEDHRASGKNPPRTIYGAIVAEADRQIDPQTVVQRTMAYSAKLLPNAPFNELYQRSKEHLLEKYAEGGYLHLWLNSERNVQGLASLRNIIRDEMQLRKMCKDWFYQSFLPQIQSLLADESDMIAKMANTAAVLHEAFGFWWIGFYRVDGQQLVLGPFQGPIACTRIPFGRGVCGTAWQKEETIIVPNVHEFAGHIACSSASNSEIVVPIWQNGNVIAVLDIDSIDYNTFDEIDKKYLEQIGLLICT